ncbi:RING finger protein 44 [Plakobranchus ocellatus]|uniref:RING finger protein 44 n=1 Tax=Plakobranchus ocellatus TaxID=259542 RepID=A0AAV4BDK4_9GAST|nr:RING finger protein 44 [Plakobranchus ocellatus]
MAQNPQEPQAQALHRESSGQLEAMAQNPQEPQAHALHRESSGQREAMAQNPQEPQAQALHRESSENPRVNARPWRRIRRNQRLRLSIENPRINARPWRNLRFCRASFTPSQTSLSLTTDRDKRMAALKSVPVIPEEATNYRHISAAIRHNDATTQRRSALRRHIAAATHNNADPIGQIPDYHSSPDNGLSEDKIQEIPTRQFSRSADRSGSDQTSCVFCMCDFQDKQLLRILPCFHDFHAECMDEWLKCVVMMLQKTGVKAEASPFVRE